MSWCHPWFTLGEDQTREPQRQSPEGHGEQLGLYPAPQHLTRNSGPGLGSGRAKPRNPGLLTLRQIAPTYSINLSLSLKGAEN